VKPGKSVVQGRFLHPNEGEKPPNLALPIENAGLMRQFEIWYHYNEKSTANEIL